VTAAAREREDRERQASSSSATPTHVVEDHAPLLETVRVGIHPGNRNPERVDSDLQRPNHSPPHRRTDPDSTFAAPQAESSRTADTSHMVETKSESKKMPIEFGPMGPQEDEQRPTSRATVSGEHGEQERQLPLIVPQTRRPIAMSPPEVSQ
jgi:hypothetical protein